MSAPSLTSLQLYDSKPEGGLDGGFNKFEAPKLARLFVTTNAIYYTDKYDYGSYRKCIALPELNGLTKLKLLGSEGAVNNDCLSQLQKLTQLQKISLKSLELKEWTLRNSILSNFEGFSRWDTGQTYKLMRVCKPNYLAD